MSSTDRQKLLEDFELLGRQMSTATILFHTAISEALGLSPIELKAIDIIDRLGPQTAGDLATHINLTSGAVTNLIDRLETKHLLRRTTDPNDRRKVIITLRPNQAVRNVGDMYDSLAASWQALCSGYSTDELALYSDFMQRTITMMQLETGKITKR